MIIIKRLILDHNVFINMWKLHIYPTSEKEVLDLSELSRKMDSTN